MKREQQIMNDPNLSAYTDKQRGWINEAFLDGVLWADSRPCENFIKWQTGEPKEEGEYLVQLKYGHIRIINWEKFNDYYNWNFFSREIIAWCKLSDIEPYKEE